MIAVGRSQARVSAAWLLRIFMTVAYVSCNNAQEPAAQPLEQELCDDTCRCTTEQGCGANNGICDEPAAVSSQLMQGTYSKDRGCVAGHCCAPHTDASDCIAEGFATCTLRGTDEQARQHIDEEPHAPTFAKYIYYSYFVVGYLYVKGKLPIIEGEVTQNQLRAAQRRRMDIKSYRVHRRVRVACANSIAVLVLVTLLPVQWRWPVPIPVLLAVVVNQFFPDKFRPVWHRLVHTRPAQVAPADVTEQDSATVQQPEALDTPAVVSATPVLVAQDRVSTLEPAGGGMQSGVLRKLGGKNKDSWQNVNAMITSSGMTWSLGTAVRDTLSRTQRELPWSSILSVSIWSDIGVEHGFEVVSTVKNGKVYKFCASDEEERDQWMSAIEVAIGGGADAHDRVIVQSDLALTSPIHSLQTVAAMGDEACGYATAVADQPFEPEPEVELHTQERSTGISNPLSQSRSDAGHPAVCVGDYA